MSPFDTATPRNLADAALARGELGAAHWLGPTPMLTLEDHKLRLKVLSLTQFSASDRERALALYGFVKRMPWGRFGRVRLHSAREVLDLRAGDSYAKTTLLVAALRLSGIPSRVRMVQLRGEVLRGLYDELPFSFHPVLECWLGDNWVRTDTHVYDAPYAAAAQEALALQGWHRGYGMEASSSTLWGGTADAFCGFHASNTPGLAVADMGVFNDPFEFVSGGRASRSPVRLLKSVSWAGVSKHINQGILKLRAESTQLDADRRDSSMPASDMSSRWPPRAAKP
jgi:hypothetical protein